MDADVGLDAEQKEQKDEFILKSKDGQSVLIPRKYVMLIGIVKTALDSGKQNLKSIADFY